MCQSLEEPATTIMSPPTLSSEVGHSRITDLSYIQLLDSIGHAVIVTDVRGNIVFWNRAAVAAYGWTAAEVSGQNIVSLARTEPFRENVKEILGTLNTGQAWSGEMPVLHRDGMELVIEATSNPVFDDAGDIVAHVSVSSDITARKIAAEKIGEEKDRLEQIFEHASAFMVLLRGPDHVYEMANAAYYQHAGLTSEIIGRRVSDVIPEVAGQGFIRLLDEVYTSGEPFIGREMPIQFEGHAEREASTRYVNFVYQPVFSEGRVVNGVLVHGVDVTEQITSRESLEKTERSNATILNKSLDIICTLDRGGRFTQVSAACERLWGFSKSELQGRLLLDLVHAADVEKTIENLLQGLDTMNFENRILTKDGSVIDMTWSSTWSSQDQLFFAIGRDVSLNKARERALREHQRALKDSEERYRNMVDTANEGVWLLDDQARTTFVNARMQKILGYEQDEMLSRHVFHFIYGEDREDMHDRFKRRRDGDGESYEIRLVHKDGSVRWVHISASPFYTDSGAFSGSLGMVQDITQRKKAEEALLREKVKAEEMARLKSAFLTNMSHEIRTPLSSIISVADILSEELTGEARSLVDILRIGGERLLLTLDSVLALAQLESNSLKLAPTQVDLVEQARDVISLFEGQAGKKGLELRLESAYGCVEVRADKGAVSRVLTNLVNNGIKFTQKGGVTVSVGREDGYVFLQVTDTGIGIGEDFIRRIFEDFQQESMGTGRSYEGVGLGLAITRRLVDLMGGNICVKSEQEVGSTFTVCLPADDLAEGSRMPSGDRAASNGARASKDCPAVGRLICPGKNCRVRNRGHLIQGSG